MRTLALIVILAAAPAAAASVDAEQAQASERLAARAQDALDGILGAGRSKVEIDVVGEHSQIDSDAEFLIPVDNGSSKAVKGASKAAKDAYQLDLPGYVKDKSAEAAKEKEKAAAAAAAQKDDAAPSQAFNRQHEASRHDSGFQIRAVHATVVFDTALASDTVREASQLLPQLLNLDMTRGDTLNLLRAPLRPLWKSAFSTPGDWRSAAYALGGGLFAVLVALIVFAGLVGAGRALGGSLGRELAAGRAPPPGAAPDEAEPLPELSPGAAGFLEEGAAAGSAAGAFAALAVRAMGKMKFASVLVSECSPATSISTFDRPGPRIPSSASCARAASLSEAWVCSESTGAAAAAGEAARAAISASLLIPRKIHHQDGFAVKELLSARGKVKPKRLPRPGSDSANTRPPWRSMIAFTIESPRPVPPERRGSAPRSNGRKRRASVAAGIPTPLSLTTHSTSAPRRRALTAMLPPGAVNLIALDTRFVTTCVMRSESRRSCGKSASEVNARVRPRSTARDRWNSTESSTRRAKSALLGRNSSLPRSIFARSSRLVTK